MSFGDAEKKKDGDVSKTWEILETLGEFQKNKSDVLKITRVRYAGKELINFQIWRTNQETMKTFPLKEQRLSFTVDLRDKIAEALAQ